MTRFSLVGVDHLAILEVPPPPPGTGTIEDKNAFAVHATVQHAYFHGGMHGPVRLYNYISRLNDETKAVTHSLSY